MISVIAAHICTRIGVYTFLHKVSGKETFKYTHSQRKEKKSMRLFDEDMDLDEMEGRPLIEKILLVSGKMLIVIGIGLMLFLEDSIIPYIVIMLGILSALTFNMLIERKEQDGGKIKWDKEIIGKMIGRAIMFGGILLAIMIG